MRKAGVTMRKANWLFNILVLIGMGLIAGLFFVFVPESSRSPVAWLNLAVAELIYLGFFGKYTLLFPAVKNFADNSPLLSVYWKSFPAYVLLSCGGMYVFYRYGFSFRQQSLLQGVILFLFFVSLAAGYWASAWHCRATVNDRVTMSRVREIQQRACELQVLLETLPEAVVFLRVFEPVLDDINTITGSDAPEAGSREVEILAQLSSLAELVPGNPDAFAANCRQLALTVKIRKQIN